MKAMVISCLLSLTIAFFIFREYYPLGTKVFVILAGIVAIIFIAVAWKRLEPPRLRLPVLSSAPKWVFISPGIVAVLFICYAFFKIFSHGDMSWDPFQSPWDIY